MNLVDLVVRIDTTDLSSAFVECTIFQPGYTCTIDYGTDPSYTNLDYRDTSPTLGRTATIRLSQRLRADTIYYYIVSAKSNSCCARVRGRFQPGRNKSFGVCQKIGRKLCDSLQSHDYWCLSKTPFSLDLYNVEAECHCHRNWKLEVHQKGEHGSNDATIAIIQGWRHR